MKWWQQGWLNRGRQRSGIPKGKVPLDRTRSPLYLMYLTPYKGNAFAINAVPGGLQRPSIPRSGTAEQCPFAADQLAWWSYLCSPLILCSSASLLHRISADVGADLQGALEIIEDSTSVVLGSRSVGANCRLGREHWQQAGHMGTPKSVPGPAVPQVKVDHAAGLGKDGPRTIQARIACDIECIACCIAALHDAVRFDRL